LPWLSPPLAALGNVTYTVGFVNDIVLSCNPPAGKKDVFYKGSPYSVAERRVPVLGSQPAGDVSHKPGGRLPLLSARPAVALATLKRAATNFAALVNRGTISVNTLPKTAI